MPKSVITKVEVYRRNEAVWERGKVVGRQVTVVYSDGKEIVVEERKV